MFLAAGCSNNSSKNTVLPEAKDNSNFEVAISHVMHKCDNMSEDTKKTLCLAESAVETTKQGTNIVKDVCSKAPLTDIYFYYSAFMLKDKTYCNYVKEDVIGCRLVTSTTHCMNYVNAEEECYEAQLDLIKIYDIELAKKRCKTMGVVNTKVKRMCKDKDWTDKYSNLTKKERFLLMYQISRLSRFSEKKVVLKK